jgi:hypothetical protein
LEEEKEHIPSPLQKPKRSVLQKLLRGLLAVVFLLILLSVFVVAFTQTSWFRNIVSTQIEKLVAEKTNGTLTIDHIDGNFISGFTVYGAHLKVKGNDADLLSADQIYARYSLWKFIQGDEIPVSSVTLRSPTINLVKLSGDSLWNYERLIPQQAAPSGPSSPFNLTIDVQNLRIENGKFTAHDYNAKTVSDSLIDWENVSVRNIDLDMRAHIIGEKNQRVQINNLSLEIERKKKNFRLTHLELAAFRNDIHVEVDGLHLISEESDVRLSALFDPLSVMAGKPLDSLEHSKIALLLNARSVSERELNEFIPHLAFLAGDPSLDLEIKGEFGKFKITKGEIGLRNDGNLSFRGEMRNLHHPNNLYLDVALKGRSLSDRSLRNYVPGLGITDMQRFGKIDIDKLTFTGYARDFKSDFDITSSVGSANGTASLDLRKKPMVYSGDIVTKNINLARLLSDTSLKSDLNSSLSFKGSGVDLKTMEGEFLFDGKGTTGFKNYSLEKFHIGGKIAKGKLELENTDMELSDSASLTSNYAVMDFSGPRPYYDLDVITKNISLTDFVPFFPRSSRVSVEANVTGVGFSSDSIMGSIKATISGLDRDKKPVPDIQLNATLQRDETPQHNRVDVIFSSMADVTLKGKYNIEKIGKIIADRFTKMTQAIKDRGKNAASSYAERSGFCDSTDLQYVINVKDLRPVAPFIPGILLLGSGKINGAIMGCDSGQMNITTEGDIHNFLLKTRNGFSDSIHIPTIRLRDTKFSFSAANISNNEQSMLHSLKAEFLVHSDSMEKFNGLIIEKPNADIRLHDGELTYSAGANIAHTVGMFISGKGNINKPDLTFDPDSLSLAFSNSFAWHSVHTPHIRIGADGTLAMDTLELIQPKPGYDREQRSAQRVKLGLLIRNDSIHYAYVQSSKIDLTDIPKFFPDGSVSSDLGTMKGFITKLDARMSGTLSRPEISADLGLKDFTFNNDPNSPNANVTMDSATINVKYHHHTLSGSGKFHVDSLSYVVDNLREGRENAKINGGNSFQIKIDSVPFLFSLKNDEQFSADSALVENRQMSLSAKGVDFPIDLFSPFVPVIAHLHGLADISMTVGGTMNKPIYNGSVDVGHGSFLLPMTNMEYDFGGKLLLSNEKLEFINIQLANLPSDDPNGRATANGYFAFKGFQVQKFNLTLTTDRLMVLSDATKETLKNIYGPLTIRTAGSPLAFSGTFDRPMLSGDIAIIQGSLTLPQTETSSSLLNDGIIYRIKRDDETFDTVHKAQLIDSLKKKLQEIAGLKDSAKYNDTLFEEALKKASTPTAAGPEFTPEQVSFQDKMLYDLNITIPGDLWFTINIKGLPPQKIFAELANGSLVFSRTEAGAKYKTVGTIGLTDKSTYTYIKEFSPVTGTLSFENDMANPILDITAEYIGEHRTPANTEEQIKIKLLVKGPRTEPNLTMEIYRKNLQGEYIRDQRSADQVQNDVFSFLATGSFTSDQGGANFADAGKSNVYSAGLGAAGQALSNFLRSQKGDIHIRSFGLDYGSQYSKIKTSLSYKDLVISYGLTAGTTQGYSSDVTFEAPLFGNILVSGLIHQANSISTDPTAQGLGQPIFLGKFLIPLF